MIERLFHYTETKARYGICNNYTIWLKLTSESRNDKKDTTYIRKILTEVVKDCKNDNAYSKKALEVMNSVLAPKGDEKKHSFIEKNIYMFCVMENRDDVAGRNLFNPDSDVYRIEFDKNKLIECFEQRKNDATYYGYFIHKNVIYDYSIQNKEILDLVKMYEYSYRII